MYSLTHLEEGWDWISSSLERRGDGNTCRVYGSECGNNADEL